MSRELFRIEQGLEILGLNEDTGVAILKGSALPGGDTGVQDDSAIGSMYLRDNGEIYQKVADTNATSDWERYAKLSDVQALDWKNKVKVLTADAAPVEGGVKDATTFSDDDGLSLTGASFSVGDRIIFGNGGVPTIGEVSGIASDDLTITYIGVEALVTNHTFVAQYYLPDPSGQENEAIIHYDGSATLVKIADVDWALATGINLSGAYTPASGNVIAGDTVEAAIQKLDGNVDAVNSAMGIAQGASDMGVYTGAIISDNNDQAGVNQELETAIEALPVPIASSADSVTAITTIDESLVDSVRSMKFLVSVTLTSDESQVESFEMFCHHDGTVGADAANVDDALYAKLKFGGGVAFNASIDLNGAGAAQTMRLRISAGVAVNVRATRINVFI